MFAAYDFVVGSFYVMAGIVCLCIAVMVISITVRAIIFAGKNVKK